MNNLGKILLVLFVTTFGCGHDETSKLQNEAFSFSDTKLTQVHEQLKRSLELGDCRIQSKITWNGERHGLQIELLKGNDKFPLHFHTTSHITSRVTIKNYLFSDKIRRITLQKIDIHSVPLSKKEVIEVEFSRNGTLTDLTYMAAVNNQWNVTESQECD